MAVSEGDKIPSATLMRMGDKGPEKVTTEEFFGGEDGKGKKVVLFAVPGAFTPVCSKAHLPGFVVNADAIKAKGVDAIACISVNDAFVMQAWGQSTHAEELVMLADGNGDFTKAMGLDMDASGFGMGNLRSQRYAMIVDSGVITKLAVEAPMKFEVSSAEAIMAAL